MIGLIRTIHMSLPAHSQRGQVYKNDSIDTTGVPYTADNLCKILLFSGSFSSFPKNSKNLYTYISHEAILCEVNYVGDTLQFEYKFGA